MHQSQKDTSEDLKEEAPWRHSHLIMNLCILTNNNKIYVSTNKAANHSPLCAHGGPQILTMTEYNQDRGSPIIIDLISRASDLYSIDCISTCLN